MKVGKNFLLLFFVAAILITNSSVAHGANDNYIILNLKNNKYHKECCEYGQNASNLKKIKKPLLNIRYTPANCCYEKKINPHKKYKPFTKRVQADAQEANIKLYFLSPLKQKKPKNECKTNACKTLLYEIDNAKESIDFAIYGISEQDRIFNALVQAEKRGVKIRWVTDMTEHNKNIYSDTTNLMKKIKDVNNDFIFHEKELKTALTNYKFPHATIMHNKFFIFDKNKIFTGSTNISSTCLTGYNSNIAVLIDSGEMANIYQQEFEQMYSGHFHTDKTFIKDNENVILSNMIVSVYFSPAHKAASKIIPIINSAKYSIYVPAFYLTHSDITNALITAYQRGVDVKIIIDETSVQGEYNTQKVLENAKVPLKVESWAGKMHMKSMIIDNDILVIGSMNFTKQGEDRNDENTLILKNAPILTKAYKEHFLILWNSIK